MKITVGTTQTTLDTSSYPDTGPAGQVLILQNLGPGDVYFDLGGDVEVTAETGIKMAAGGGYEVPNWHPGMRLKLISSTSSTDVRFSVVG